MRTLINGAAANQLSVYDRGLNYGDGCFTTIAVRNGELQLWHRHWQRLLFTCTQLAIPLPDESLFLQDAQDLMSEFKETTAVLKIVITRGSGGRGYTPPTEPEVTRIVSIGPMPEHYAQWRQQGINLASANLQLAVQPALGGMKTLNRLEQVLLKQELEKLKATVSPKPDDLIVCDTRGFVCEATMGNLFWRKGDTWCTPEVKDAGIAGVVRAELLTMNPQIRVGQYLPEDLANADEIFVCNSLLGLVPVSNINGNELAVRVYSESWQMQL